ncbi:hypothetical protein C8J57DRAFT_1223842 [Mycena rebaudengoi]|nr:hypothetical protein C8J57DRAFT_1223842 [Mycena rebaudengoi]
MHVAAVPRLCFISPSSRTAVQSEVTILWISVMCWKLNSIVFSSERRTIWCTMGKYVHEEPQKFGSAFGHDYTSVPLLPAVVVPLPNIAAALPSIDTEHKRELMPTEAVRGSLTPTKSVRGSSPTEPPQTQASSSATSANDCVVSPTISDMMSPSYKKKPITYLQHHKHRIMAARALEEAKVKAQAERRAMKTTHKEALRLQPRRHSLCLHLERSLEGSALEHYNVLYQSAMMNGLRVDYNPSAKVLICFISGEIRPVLDARGMVIGVLAFGSPPGLPWDNIMSSAYKQLKQLYNKGISGDSSEKAFEKIQANIRRRHPDSAPNILSHYLVAKKLEELTGAISFTDDMCWKGCIGFTGPNAVLDNCTECERGPDKDPHRQFHTIPLGLQLQALWRSVKGATTRRYRTEKTTEILAEPAANGGQLKAYDNGIIKEKDMLLIFSVNGAQLYTMKDSNCWM